MNPAPQPPPRPTSIPELQARLAELRATVAALQGESAQLGGENEQLRATVAALQGDNAQLRAELEQLRAELEQLRGPQPPPAWVKPNRPRPQPPPRPRQRRAQSCTRRREPEDTITEWVEHALDACPDCGRRLQGGWLHDTRQVLDLPETPLVVREHRIIARHCGVCQRRCLPQLTPQQLGVSGPGRRFGIRLQSLVSHLHLGARMPLRTIQALLGELYGLQISLGALTDLLQDTARRGAAAVAALLEDCRQAPWVQMDETSWRENGQNGHLWCLTTDQARYYEIHRSRAGAVAQELLGAEYEGVLVSDFYSGYHWYDGEHQRCWVHLLRDLRAVREAHPADAGVQRWTRRVAALYRLARRWARQPGGDRRRATRYCEEAALRLAAPHRGREGPLRLLAERLERFVTELFVFVAQPGVPSDNNGAERAIRPAVVIRKVSGGTRSPRGSVTKAALLSLWESWRLQGRSPLAECRALLAG